MTPLLYVFYAAFVGLAVVWPLAFFGHRFYADLVAAENEKHARQGGGH
jgi:hypothetical protein